VEEQLPAAPILHTGSTHPPLGESHEHPDLVDGETFAEFAEIQGDVAKAVGTRFDDTDEDIASLRGWILAAAVVQGVIDMAFVWILVG
jgi:hypothetical protein